MEGNFDEKNEGNGQHEAMSGTQASHNDLTDQGENCSQVYTAAERSFAFNGNATPDGSGYTTPTGGHGYVYAPGPSGKGNGNGSKKQKILVVASCLIIAALFIACFSLGALLFSEKQTPENEHKYEQTKAEVDTEFNTTNGVFVVIDPNDTYAPETDTDAVQGVQETQTSVAQDATGTTGEILTPQNPMPTTATLFKKSPLRVDANGDGKADVVLDEKGYVLTSADTHILPAATVVHKVAQSVVEITTETVVQSGRLGQYVTSGAGSGVIISKEGFIITNNHVIEGADSITVTLTDGTRYTAVLVGTDAKTDVALLWIDPLGRELTVATLGSSFDLVVGEEILAIGNPLGSLGGTVTEGIISATVRQINMDGTYMTLLQVSSPINPGNSGGGLFNMAGELVGIVNAKYADEEVEGLGFAIPIDTAYDVVCELYQYGYVRGRPTTGLTLIDATSTSMAMYYFHSPYTGVYVYTSSLTDELQTGDLILSFGGVEVTSSSQITSVVEGMAVGDQVEVIVYRGGKQLTVTLTLGEYKPQNATNGTSETPAA